MSNSLIRTILISSVGIFLFIAIVAIIIIFFKIRKKKKEIQQKQNLYEALLKEKESEIKMYTRQDLGVGDYQLQALLGTTINHEIVEFCINSCIRNEYHNVLLVGEVEPYEVIVLSYKANANVYVQKHEFDIDRFNQVKDYQNVQLNQIKIIDQIPEQTQYDAIMVLNSYQDFEQIFIKYHPFLKEKGMFIFANSKSNKKSKNKLIQEVQKMNYRYENINWYTGFVVIVKSFV